MSDPENTVHPNPPDPPPLGEAVRAWAKVGYLGFGGPAGQIALMQRVFVDEKRWLSEDRFLHALSFCMLLPGPEAQQLATYVGWLLRGVRGAVLAGILFILPGAMVMLALSVLYQLHGEQPLVEALFLGVRAAVVAIVFDAVRRLWLRALVTPLRQAFAAVSFIALFAFGAPFPLVVLAAGLAGWMLRGRLVPAAHGAVAEDEGPAPDPALLTWRRALKVMLRVLAIWFAPVALILAWLGPDHVLGQIGPFFSVMAVVTFGGAYAVLAYVAQQAVEAYAWLSPGEMLDGLGLAETTPGPLILVVQFVGHLAAARGEAIADLGPVAMGTIGAALTLWVTFAPSFLWILAGAPHIERLRRSTALTAALAGITAAVVGVMANLALWLTVHVAFARVEDTDIGPLRLPVPELASIDWPAVAIATVALAAMLRFRVGLLWVLGAAALAGLVVGLVSA